MKIDRKVCQDCIWYKAYGLGGRATCAIKRTTLHQLFCKSNEVDCYDYEYYCQHLAD